MIVADSNLVAYLLIPSAKSSLAEEIFLKDSEWAAPLIWRSEFCNIITLYMRHQGMSLSQGKSTMAKAEKLFGGRSYQVPAFDVLELTHRYPVTAYDAEFVVLACQAGVPLVTFDKALHKAFLETAISADRFLGRKNN